MLLSCRLADSLAVMTTRTRAAGRQHAKECDCYCSHQRGNKFMKEAPPTKATRNLLVRLVSSLRLNANANASEVKLKASLFPL